MERKQGQGYTGYWTPIDAFNQLWKINKTKKKIGLDRLGVLWLIERYSASKSVGCWRTCNSIAKELGVTREHVARTIKEFVERGLIVRLGEATIGNIMRPMWATCFTDKWMFHPQETQEGPPKLRSGKDWEKAARKIIRKWNKGTRKDDKSERLSVKVIHNPKAFSDLFIKKFRKNNSKSFRNEKESSCDGAITPSCDSAVTSRCDGAITQSNMKKAEKRKQTLSERSSDSVRNKPAWSGESTSPKPKYSEFALKCAKTLWRKVKADFPLRVKWQRSSVQEWATHFQRLLNVDGRSKQDIRIVLNDHIANMADPYQPAAYCGAKFRDMFERIADAMDRRKNRKQAKGESNKLNPEEML